MEPSPLGMSMGDLLFEGGEYLASRGIEEPSLNSKILLSHTLGLEGDDLLFWLQRAASAESAERYWGYLRRRGAGEPVQYIRGKVYWLDLDLVVESGVFIPRPETETLLEAVVNSLKRRGDAHEPLVVLDIGTGSGNIAIALARQLPESTVYASDISLSALRVARQNIRLNGVAERVHCLEGDSLKPFRRRKMVDLIVSNPPYVRTRELRELPIEVRGHEPRFTLDGGRDGLRLTRRLLEGAPDLLKDKGMLALELGPGQGEEVKGIAASQGIFKNLRIVRDLSGKERVALMEL